MLVNENGKVLDTEALYLSSPTHPPPSISDVHMADPPPPYSATSTSSSDPTRSRPRPTNSLYLSHTNSSIKGAFVIDPYMTIPPSLLPALRRGETERTRKNVSITSTNGSINVELAFETNQSHFVDDSKKLLGSLDQPLGIHLESTNGSITTRLSDALPQPRRPFDVSISSTNGKISLAIPRTFSGSIQVNSRDMPHLSEELKPCVATISQSSFYVGDLSVFSGESCLLDKILLRSSNGKIILRYDDEVESDQSFRSGQKGKGGVFRFLGF